MCLGVAGACLFWILFDLDSKLDLYFGRFQINIYIWLPFFFVSAGLGLGPLFFFFDLAQP